MSKRTDEVEDFAGLILNELKDCSCRGCRNIEQKISNYLIERPLPTTSGDEELIEWVDHVFYPPLKGNPLQKKSDQELLTDHDRLIAEIRKILAIKNQQITEAKAEEREMIREVVMKQKPSYTNSWQIDADDILDALNQ